MIDVVDPDHRKMANRFIATLATYRNAEDLINIGAYVAGSNPKIDEAIGKIDAIQAYLQQGIQEQVTLNESVAGLKRIFS